MTGEEGKTQRKLIRDRFESLVYALHKPILSPMSSPLTITVAETISTWTDHN